MVATNAVTSETHPMRLSWVSATGADGGGGGGRLGLCFCPGKQIQRSRLRAGHEESGQPIMRDLGADLRRLRQHYGVTQLVCLLNDAELRSLGVRCVYRGAVEVGIFVSFRGRDDCEPVCCRCRREASC